MLKYVFEYFSEKSEISYEMEDFFSLLPYIFNVVNIIKKTVALFTKKS
jgi:hypothetical protein